MTRTQAIFATLLAYNVLLVAIGLWARRRTHDQEDFFLGGRTMGGWVAALSASASSSSAWTLLGVSGAAYAWGISAIWLFPATLSGFLINWLWVAPRLMKQSRAGGSITLSEFLAGDRRNPWFRTVMRLSTFVVVFSFLFYIASQFQAAGHAFENAFGTSPAVSIGIGVTIIVLYTLLGGFWAVSVTDLIQGLVMAACALMLPIVSLIAVGGPAGLIEGLRTVSTTAQLQWTGAFSGVMAIAFVAGTLGIGIGYPGQPHVVNRFMALRDPAALRTGRTVAISWAVIIYSGMLLTGWCARVLYNSAAANEQILFETANQLLPPVLAGVVIAAVLSAIMSTADSQLLVATSSLSYDLRQKEGAVNSGSTPGLFFSRAIVVAISLGAMLLGIFAPAEIFSRVLFAWSALGATFGPTLLLKLGGMQIRTPAVVASMATGFVLTLLANWYVPDAPGDWVERIVPFVFGLIVASMGRTSRGTVQ